ncbi:MAG TPA: sugar phosphate isomerase/epimerase family protein [Bryobacteraceae bacterium]|nr:sugar phosphate isomerase/epimerase family protein [Bryobacteraceae bacterium]
MKSLQSISRRSFLALAASAPLVPAMAKRRVPVGLELYSVRDQLKEDLFGTVRAVAKMGYEGVEFYSPYFSWTPAYAKDVRKLLDDLGIVCFSTHNGSESFAPQNLEKAIELNKIIGSKIIVMASAGKVEGIDGWKGVADRLNAGAEKFKTQGLRAGFHNHQTEFKPIDGQKPIEVLAARTTKDVVLQLDVGTCVDAGSDPVAWIQKNPGRIRSVHCKDWSPEKGYKVLFGEGASPWKKIFEAAEKTGGVEYYLIEQEGSDYPPLETVERCLASFKKIHA